MTTLDPALRSTLGTLKAGADEALQTLYVLQQTINNNGVPEMVQWPEILDKYDVMMRKLLGLQHTLERGFTSPDLRTGFLQFSSLREISVVPSAPLDPGEPQGIFNILTRTMREPDVLEADKAAAAHLDEHLGLTNLADEVVNVRMAALIDQHDARVARAVAIVEEIGAQYNWAKREDDLEDEDEDDMEEGGGQRRAHEPLAGTSQDSVGPSVSQRAPVQVEDDSDDDMEMVAGSL